MADSIVDLFRPHLSPEAAQAAARVLTPDPETGRAFIGTGPLVDRFERELATLLEAEPERVFAVNSCTSALTLAYHLCGVGPGSVVVSTPMTCSATNGPIVTLGGRIAWADVDPLTGRIDPASVAAVLRRLHRAGEQAAAVVAVDWGGGSCDYNALRVAAGSVPIVQDAAHSLLATHNGRYMAKVGGDFQCYSFGPIKTLSCQHGGALLTPPGRRDLAERAHTLRWHGLDRRSSADFRCVHPMTKVRMVNGPAVSIARIVRERLDGPIYSLENGELVPRRIVGWHATPRAGRRYVRVWTETLGPVEAGTFTEDHRLLTRGGWKPINALVQGESVATAYAAPSALQRQILIGGLLGDCHLNYRRTGANRCVVHETHTAVDREYAALKTDALAGLGARLHDLDADKKHPNGWVHYWTKSSPALMELRRAFYPVHEKVIPRTLLEDDGLSDLALAVWYMDDGHTSVHNGRDGLNPYCHLATNAFSEEDVVWAADYLTDLGFACRPTYGSGWRLSFTKEGSRRLVERIARFVPPGLRYKVAHLPDLAPFDRTVWGSGASPVFYDRCFFAERTETNWNAYQTVYCLTIEGGGESFAAGPVIAHNCAQDITEAGYNFSMTDVEAAVLLANLPHVRGLVHRHREIAAAYTKAFRGLPGQTVAEHDPGSSYWVFPVLVDDRDGLSAHLAERGIASSQVHRRNDTHPAFRAATHPASADLRQLDRFAAHQLNLPCGWWLTERNVAHVLAAVAAWSVLAGVAA